MQKSVRVQPKKSPTALFPILFLLFFLLFFLKNAPLLTSDVQKSVTNCLQTVVPTLFPFSVLSSCLLGLGLENAIPKPVRSCCASLFSLPESATGMLAVGLLCGFPVGCRMAAEKYRTGGLTAREFADLVFLTAVPSPAFVLGAAGGILGNVKFGWWTEGCLWGLISLFGLFRRKSAKPEEASDCSPPRVRFSRLFCTSVVAAAKTVLTVCAYVVFFSAVTSSLHFAAISLHFPQKVTVFLSGLLELTAGVTAAATLQSTAARLAFFAFSVGFSGISLHCQLLTFCPENALNYAVFCKRKLLLGLTLAGVSCGIFSLFPRLFETV